MPEMEGTDKEKPAKTMDADHVFRFQCSPGVACFTRCCADVTIALTPYDVIRLKNALGITSEEFLDNYTVIIPRENRLIPLVLLKMSEQDKRCPLVTDKGCSVYEDRPWPCRMYPLNMEDDGTFRVIADPSLCRGLKEEETWQISEWLVDQGVVPDDEMNTLFSSVTIPLSAQSLDVDNPQILKMVFMALYNIDKFRDFVFKCDIFRLGAVSQRRIVYFDVLQDNLSFTVACRSRLSETFRQNDSGQAGVTTKKPWGFVSPCNQKNLFRPPEGLMKHPDSKLRILQIDHAGHLDLRGADHRYVDVVLGKGLKHL